MDYDRYLKEIAQIKVLDFIISQLAECLELSDDEIKVWNTHMQKLKKELSKDIDEASEDKCIDDMVNHPSHYTGGNQEVIDTIDYDQVLKEISELKEWASHVPQLKKELYSFTDIDEASEDK